MSKTTTKSLKGLYKKMTGNEAAGNTTAKVLNEIATSMGPAKKGMRISECIDEITDNYTPGGGSSDFSTATVTLVNAFGDVSLPIVVVYPEYNVEGSWTTAPDEDGDYTVILHKGKLYINQGGIDSVSGNITLDETSHMYVVTGDCTITCTTE